VVQSLNGARAAAAASAQLGASLGVTGADLTDLATEAAQAFSAQAQTEALVGVEERAPEIPGVETQKRPNVASQVLVGMMLFFMLFGASTPARSILDEHREGTLARLFTTPTPRSVILGGKYIAVFLVVLIQAVVLVVAGWLLLRADWGEPGPVAVLVVASALVAASLGLVTISFAKTPAQAGAVSSAIFVFLGLISGNFTGGVSVGGAYAIVQKISPLGWLMQAWKDVLYGGSWGSIALPVVVVLGFTLAFFGIATFFFRRRYA
jgi:ABC-2 type transport system permease protein